MIDLLDDALREFLIQELPVRDNEIDISFDQPRREWSARLSRPTLNIYLRDIRENVKLRAPSPGGTFTRGDSSARFERDSVRLELAYVMTAWAKDPLDEHRILSRLLAALFRFRGLPDAVAAEHLPGQPADILFRVAQPDNMVSGNDLWSVLDNEMRPYVDVVAQLAIFPHEAVEYPLVRSIEMTLVQRNIPGRSLDWGAEPEPAEPPARAPNGLRLPVRIQQVPSGATPEAKRSSPPWPPAAAAPDAGAAEPPAPSTGSKKGGKGKQGG